MSITEKRSILHDWVTQLGLRHQGVLLTSIRGCDGVPKYDHSKPVMRAIRFMTIVNYDFRETTDPKGFTYWNPKDFQENVTVFSKNLDEYPAHFVFHVIHALEVIGYSMPRDAFANEPNYAAATAGQDVALLFEWAYRKLVKKFHLNPETRDQLEARMHEDRIANDTVAQ